MSETTEPCQIRRYQTDDGAARVEVRFARETAWLSLGQIAELFQTHKTAVSRHLLQIASERDPRDRGVAEFEGQSLDGRHHAVVCFDLETILSVGARVQSPRTRPFEAWATQRHHRAGNVILLAGSAVAQRRTSASPGLTSLL